MDDGGSVNRRHCDETRSTYAVSKGMRVCVCVCVRERERERIVHH